MDIDQLQLHKDLTALVAQNDIRSVLGHLAVACAGRACDVADRDEAEDWAAIQRGETNPFNAWTGGQLKVAGDAALFQQLADAIVRAWAGDT